jgi:hypothetical protein
MSSAYGTAQPVPVSTTPTLAPSVRTKDATTTKSTAGG